MNILIIDAQGGGIGWQLVLSVKQALPNVEITAVGTNAAHIDERRAICYNMIGTAEADRAAQKCFADFSF